MHWFVCKDHRHRVTGDESALRAGRVYLHFSKQGSAHVGWSFFNGLNWLGASLRLSLEDGVSLSVTLIRLAHLWVVFPLPSAWLRPFMIDDRVFAVKLGYVGAIADIDIWHADWAEDCGMTDYYRRQKPCKYTKLQLWPGWNWRLRLRPLDWIFGRIRHGSRDLACEPISFWMDGREVFGTWTLSEHYRMRSRWPFVFGRWYGSNLEIEKPPQFAGKGENSWDCDDDAIYGMSTGETTVAGAIGRYIEAVLKNRKRYGMPHRESVSA